VAAVVDIPKLHEKAIIASNDEVADLLDLARKRRRLSERQKQYHALTKNTGRCDPDAVLGTGIASASWSAFDLDDVDLKTTRSS
jgi:hypothetical protein